MSRFILVSTIVVFGGALCCPALANDARLTNLGVPNPTGLVEGSSFVAVVCNFCDADASSVAANYSVLINWGDGTTPSPGTVATCSPAVCQCPVSGNTFSVTGSHTYARFGTYGITTDIRSLTPDSGQTFHTTQMNVPIQAVGSNPAVSAITITGIPVDQVIADLNAMVSISFPTNSDLTITLHGPGNLLDILANARGGSGSNGYASTLFDDDAPNPIASAPLPFTNVKPESALSVFNGRSPDTMWTLQVTNGGTQTGTLNDWSLIVRLASTLSVNGNAVVADAPITAAGRTLSAFPGASFTSTVATFTDANPNSDMSDFTATIDWGDLNSSAGTITANPSGGYIVTGTHSYAVHGAFAAHVRVDSLGGATSTANTTVDVKNVAITANSLTFDATTGVLFSGTVATFTAANADATASDYTATIGWGDNKTNGGVIVANDSGGFDVRGSHTYSTSLIGPVVVNIAHARSPSTTASTISTADLVLPSLTVSDAAVTEGDDGTVNAVFVVTLAQASTLQVNVDYTTLDGTAKTSDGDYQAAAGTLFFSPGETVKTIDVVVVGDTRAEPDETFTVQFSNPVNAKLDVDHATGTIVNDDAGGGSGSGGCGVCGGGAGLFSSLTLIAIMFMRGRRRR